MFLSPIAKRKWTQNIETNGELPQSWQKYVKLYEDAAFNYKPCHSMNLDAPNDGSIAKELSKNIHNPPGLSETKVSCHYQDVIRNDLSVFTGGIR